MNTCVCALVREGMWVCGHTGTHALMHGCMEAGIHGCRAAMQGWKDGRMDGRMDEGREAGRDGWMD